MHFQNTLLGSIGVVLGLAWPLLAQPRPGTLLWTCQAGNSIWSSPTLAADGTVYVATSILSAVTNSGSTASNKWTFPAAISGSPAVGGGGTIYFVGSGGTLYAVNPDGSQKWTFSGSGGGGGSPAIGVDGTIYFQGYSGVYAITPSGTVKWKSYPGDSGNFSSPVIGPDGTIYTGSWEFARFYAIKPDGTQKWVADLSSRPGDSAAIGADGTIYISAGHLYAFAPGGTNLWYIGDQFNGTPVIGKGGEIYVASFHVLYALTPGGQFLWNALGSSARVGLTTPAVDAGGRTYYCVSNSVWALNPQGQVQWKITQSGNPGPGGDFAITSPIIGPEGTLYAALGSTLYAIATGTNGPANSPWPMYRQNARHTGRVEKPALKQPQKRSDANFQFQLYPQLLGQTYTIESSTNLSNWTSLTSFVATTLPMAVLDLSASNFPSRFYRASSPP